MKRDKTSYREAANRLKARRMARGIPVPVMADRLGVSAARYRTWEKLFGPLPQRQYGAAIDRILDDGAPCHPGDIPHIEQPFCNTYANLAIPSQICCLLPASSRPVSPQPRLRPEPSSPQALHPAELAVGPLRAARPYCNRFFAAFTSRS